MDGTSAKNAQEIVICGFGILLPFISWAFFDASLDGYKYGLNIYNPNASGMNKIRQYILDNNCPFFAN